MKDREIMKHEIETATISHTQEEIFFLKAMLPKHQEIEADPLRAYKATLYPDTIYMHQSMN